MTTVVGELEFPDMDGKEISPGIFLVGEPTPVPGTDTLHALADVGGMLCVIELKLKFCASQIQDAENAAGHTIVK